MESGNKFYIGWKQKAPPEIARFYRGVVITMFVLFMTAGIVLALMQKKFGTGNFEFGRLTEVTGVYFNKPVSCIKVVNGKDMLGNLSYITIPLVGFGKTGVDGIMADIEKNKAVSLHQKQISLKGTLLYNDGKLLMQVDANDHPVIRIGSKADASLLPVEKDLGILKLKGEIVDPKCYFGVMKPGEGKTHKDCAIRCILGGIPPVLKISDEKGYQNYYLIKGPHGEKMNQVMKNYIARQVELSARVVRFDDWIVLYLQDNTAIRPISGWNLSRPFTPKLANTVNCYPEK